MNLETLAKTPPWEWPESASKVIDDVLTDRGAPQSDRLVAAELAGDAVAINDELAATLLAIVANDSEPEQLRGRAAISLGPALELAWTGDLEDSDEVPVSERVLGEIRASLRRLYFDERVPTEVRRRVLEASVRWPDDWHADAIKAAYASGDSDWKLTAVFSMGWVRGFADQILEALESTDPGIHFAAVEAAGNWELDAAWPHVLALVDNPATPRPLLLAAIEAVGNIRPEESIEALAGLAASDDEEIAEAAEEAIELARARTADDEDADEEDEDDEEDKWIN
jgi:hypothetical protein